MPQLTVARLNWNRQLDYGEEKCETVPPRKSLQTWARVRFISFAPLNITFRNASDKEIPFDIYMKSTAQTIAVLHVEMINVMCFTKGHSLTNHFEINVSKEAKLINLAHALHQFKPLELVFLPNGYLQRKHPWIFLSFLMASFPAFVAQMLVKITPRLQHASRTMSCLCTRELSYPSPFLSRHLRFIRSAEISKYCMMSSQPIKCDC